MGIMLPLLGAGLTTGTAGGAADATRVIDCGCGSRVALAEPVERDVVPELVWE